MSRVPRGSLPPLVTPFKGGEVDHEGYAGLIERQIAAGSHGVVVAGTSGEPGVLSLEERERLADCAVETASGRIPVLVHTGTADLRQTLQLTRHAEEIGADAVLVVTPYYLRPSQHGLVNYFTKVAESTELPVILYDIPMRTGVALDVETIVELSEVENIVGIKETRTDLEHVTRVIARCGPEFSVYCGLETLCLPVLILGGVGHVSATGNVAPVEMARLADAAFDGDWDTARDLHYSLLEINEAVFADTNPVPMKTMLAELGLIEDPEVRPPLAPLLPAARERVLAALAKFQEKAPTSPSSDAALANS